MVEEGRTDETRLRAYECPARDRRPPEEWPSTIPTSHTARHRHAPFFFIRRKAMIECLYTFISLELKPLAQKASDSVLIVVANHCGDSSLDMLPGILRRIGFIGYGEHANVVLAVAEANHLAGTELRSQDIHSATSAGIAMVYIDPLCTIAFQGCPGVGDEILHYDAAIGLNENGDLSIAQGTYPRAALYTALVAASFRVFGISDIAARLPAVIASLIWSLLLYSFVRQIASRSAAWICLAVLIEEMSSGRKDQRSKGKNSIKKVSGWTCEMILLSIV